MPRQDQPCSPSQGFKHRLVFGQNCFFDGDDQITVTSLRILLQTLFGNGEFFKRSAETSLDFPLQYFLKFGARLRRALHSQHECSGSRFGQTHRPPFLSQ
jgi:hypothetical protein